MQSPTRDERKTACLPFQVLINSVEAAQTRVMLVLMLALKGYYTFFPGSRNHHTWYIVGNQWIFVECKEEACYVTKPETRCDWYKNKWHISCSQFNLMEKKDQKTYYKSRCYILLVAMLRPAGDSEWSLMENDTEEVEMPCTWKEEDVRECW